MSMRMLITCWIPHPLLQLSIRVIVTLAIMMEPAATSAPRISSSAYVPQGLREIFALPVSLAVGSAFYFEW